MAVSSALEASNPLGTLESLEISAFTVFTKARFDFAGGMNIIVGENGTGKSHLLKLAYGASKVLYPSQPRRLLTGKDALGKAVAEKLFNVFLPDTLGRLCQRTQGRQRASVDLEFNGSSGSSEQHLSFLFSTNSESSVTINASPDLPDTSMGSPIFLPTREIISLMPEFISNYARAVTRFDETYYDLALALGAGLKPGKRTAAVNKLIEPLERAMGGTLFVDSSGRVYLKTRTGGGTIEMPLLAEGLRKIAMLAFLILNGSLAQRGTVYWDEPETNLNPLLITSLAEVLVLIAASGAQVVIATHSLFLMREIALQLDSCKSSVDTRYFSLVRDENGVKVQSADGIDDLDTVPALEAAIAQDTKLEDAFWAK